MTERIRDLRDRPAPERDDTMRGRLPTQEQRERDAKVARMLAFGWTYRATAARLGVSLGAVQRSVQRNAAAKRARLAGRNATR